MAKNCQIGYEVALDIPSMSTTRSVVFVSKKMARKFMKKWPSARLHAVEVCDGKIKRRGKRAFY